MKFKWLIGPILVPLVLNPFHFGTAQTPTSKAAPTSLDLEKEKLDIEKLKLENEKLKMELEKAKLQSQTPTFVPTPELSGERAKEVLEKEQLEVSNRARDLAKAHKNEDDLLVLDLFNAEFWHKGVRYQIHDFYDMPRDEKLPMVKTLLERLANGSPRYRYRLNNLVFLKYESRDRGVFEIMSPKEQGDFRIVTPEGITMDSEIGDIRNGFQGIYFRYNGQGERDGYKTIRYEHGGDLLAFGDKLEFLVDKDGKIHEIRYGALDEN